jgi:hypothetical protein
LLRELIQRLLSSILFKLFEHFLLHVLGFLQLIIQRGNLVLQSLIGKPDLLNLILPTGIPACVKSPENIGSGGVDKGSGRGGGGLE